MVAVRILAAVMVAVVAIGCGEKKKKEPVRLVAVDSVDASPNEPPPPPAFAPVFDMGGAGEVAALDAIGAVPAWQAVVERSRLLARRGATGAVSGRLTGERDGYRWLVDETEGFGSLAIRIALFGEPKKLAPGTRIVATGAWIVDNRSWVFRTSKVEQLSGVQAPAELTELLPLSVALGQRPNHSTPASKKTRAGAVLFYVVGEPRRLGDGWTIADTAKGAPAAYLVLPGEREPYGAQNYMAQDEYWRLQRGVRYAVEIKRFRLPKRPGELPMFRATKAPIELIGEGAKSPANVAP